LRCCLRWGRARFEQAGAVAGTSASTLISIAAIGLIAATPISPAAFGIPSPDFTLLSANGSTVIGRVRFALVQRTSQHAVVQAKYQFASGEYDIDEDSVRLQPNKTSTLIKYKHSYFHPDGSVDRVNEADFVSGTASCIQYLNGRPKAENAKLSFPDDTYAGPLMIVPIRDYIQSSSREAGAFHYFSCIPRPRIYRIMIAVQRHVHWSLYGGELDKVDLQPDFGLLGFLLSRAVPSTELWFDSADHLGLIGVKTYSYYKGLEFIMLRSLTGR
jgi:hypothetical protein